MVNILSLLAYGDSLVTLSLLEQRGKDAPDLSVVGTALTVQVKSLMRNSQVRVVSILPRVAAFYALRASGPVRGAVDMIRVRRWARSLSRNDVVLVETEDWRNAWLGVRSGSLVQIPRVEGAYIDRAKAFAPYVGPILLAPCARPKLRATRLVLNPSARQQARYLSRAIIEETIGVARGAGVEICLIDTDGSLGEWRNAVSEYLLRPSLEAANDALRTADRYVGPDSFFIHLAYYHQVPFLGFFHESNSYFAPPGMKELGNFMYFAAAEDRLAVRGKLEWFFGPGLAHDSRLTGIG